MRLFWPEFILALECLPIGVYSLEFINPPPFAATTDFSLNTIYVEGSILNIEWTAGPAGNNTSLTLWQLNGTQYLQPFEYLTQNVSDSITSLAWTVQTTRNLAISNMFYLCMFLVGASSSIANSHYFNITSKTGADQSPSSSTGSSATTTTNALQLSSGSSIISTPGSASIPNSVMTPGLTSTSTTPLAMSSSINASGGLSTGAKAGLGVGIPAAVLLGIGAGWLFFGWRKKQDTLSSMEPTRKIGVDQREQEKWQRHQLMGDEHMMEPPVFELQDSGARGEQEVVK